MLFVNNSAGDNNRVHTFKPGEPITLSIEAPPVPHGAFPGRFALYICLEEPALEDMAEQPFGIGISCMPLPLSKGNISAPPFTAANNIGFEESLGYPLIPGIPSAPCSIFGVPELPMGTYTFQGYIFDGGSSGLGLSLTNAIVVKVQ